MSGATGHGPQSMSGGDSCLKLSESSTRLVCGWRPRLACVREHRAGRQPASRELSARSRAVLRVSPGTRSPARPGQEPCSLPAARCAATRGQRKGALGDGQRRSGAPGPGRIRAWNPARGGVHAAETPDQWGLAAALMPAAQTPPSEETASSGRARRAGPPAERSAAGEADKARASVVLR